MDFIPQNELEAALIAAATDASARPRFYEILSKADLLVIDESPGPAEATGHRVLEAGRSLQLRHLDVGGVPHIPVFSSSARSGPRGSPSVDGPARELPHPRDQPARSVLQDKETGGRCLPGPCARSEVRRGASHGDRCRRRRGPDFERLMGEAAIVLDGVVQKGEVVDFIRITKGGVSDYMTKDTKPFYRRKWLGLF